MAEVQDEEQWLYGDVDKDENTSNAKVLSTKNTTSSLKENQSENNSFVEDTTVTTLSEEPVSDALRSTIANGEAIGTSQKSTEGDEQSTEKEVSAQNGDKSRGNADDDSSSDDEPTVTIGKIVKQPDIMRPPPPTHRAAPTSGLKDDDFNSAGKINGVPAPEYNLQELEEKPWRKPGADLSDYFNYGFMEDTWIKYCERQKAMRIHESGVGLATLGINIGKSMFGSSNIPVSIMNDNSKYGGQRKPAGVPVIKSDDNQNSLQGSGVNTIQVMTADRRTYSNKVLANSGQGNYDEMDFGGNPYGADFFSTPPPNFYTPPPTGPWGGIPNIPPPGWMPEGIGPPPPMPRHREPPPFFDEDLLITHGVPSRSKEREIEKIIRDSLDSRDSREQERERDRDRDSRSRDRESRRHARRRSRSRSKSRHKRARSKSRSRSPSHKHKRKKSKREREAD